MRKLRLLVIASAVAAITLGGMVSAGSALFGPAFPVASNAAEGNWFPSISYDFNTGQSLVVYASCSLACPTEDEAVKGQIIALDGTLVGTPITISVEKPSLGHDEFEPPFVAYNSTSDEWLVLWTDDTIVYGQRISSSSARLGANFVVNDGTVDFGGPTVEDKTFTDIEQVEAAWSPVDNVWLVAWKATIQGFDIPSVSEQQIYGEFLNGDGSDANSGAGILVSNTTFGANDGVAVAYSTVSDVWLVGWKDDNSDQAWGRILSFPAAGGSAVPPSSPGTDFGAPAFQVGNSAGSGVGGAPAIAYDGTRDRFLVAWPGNQGADAASFTNLGASEVELFGRFVTAGGAVVSSTDQRLTDVPDDGSNYGAVNRPSAAYDPIGDRYVLVAHGKGYPNPPTKTGFEVWAQQVAGDGTLTGDTTRVTTLAATHVGFRPKDVFVGRGCFQAVWFDPTNSGSEPSEGLSVVTGALVGCDALAPLPPEPVVTLPSFTG